jgi:phosphopantothenoylcysteine decarboxylase/phosphopantothenate--cysteine ligase
MGIALAEAALDSGHEVVVISGPVSLKYPPNAELFEVVSTEDLLHMCERVFPACDGIIGAAAPCDYRPEQISARKLQKNGEPLFIKLVETPDVIATLGASRLAHQWLVGFALETENHKNRAFDKLRSKKCDLMVLNGPAAMNSLHNSVDIVDHTGNVVASHTGAKNVVARGIVLEINRRLIHNSTPTHATRAC